MGQGERRLLQTIRARAGKSARAGAARGRELRVGIGDDAAVLRLRTGEELVVTTDFSLEDVHFRRAWHPPDAVGHKCLARGLSDVAAMGARPVAVFLSLAVPAVFTQLGGGRKGWPGSNGNSKTWVERFYDGLLLLADRYSVPLAGGDLAQVPGDRSAGASPKAAADIVVLGAVRQGRALLRSGAQAGDTLYVTGTLGGAAAELRALEAHPPRFQRVLEASTAHPHFFPEPRVAAGLQLAARRLARASIDVSDGLSVDLLHLCEASGLAAEVDADALPLGAGATIADALHGGDDYELLFTADPAAKLPARLGGVEVHSIGRMVRKRRGQPRVTLIRGGKREPLLPGGWEHF